MLQLRLSSPLKSTLVTGVKRNIQLVQTISVNAEDSVTVLDISMEKNIVALLNTLDNGASVFYVDHHRSGDIPQHKNLTALIDLDANTCTALIVDKHLKGEFHDWAICAAYGDNLIAKADALSAAAGHTKEQSALLKELGTLINYNGYGANVADLHFDLADLYQALLAYASPFDVFDDKLSPYYQLQTAYQEDLEKALAIPALHQSDLLKSADDILRLKRIIRSQARLHGVTACFMAKPMENVSGSGMHFHVSMYDKKGTNLFAEKSKKNINPNLLYALGGLTKTMGESMLIFAPNANSWRRLVLGSYAPVTPNWGMDNRSVAFRIPSSDSKNRRIEHRVSGVDANPYLVALTLISAMRYGMKNKIKAPNQTKGNAYEQKKSHSKKDMPHDWSSAILTAKKSKFLKEILGLELHRAFIAIKEMEYQKVASTVSELDIDLYLNAI